MYDLTRGLIVLCASAAAGALIWMASQPDASQAGGYWKMIGLLAAAGLAFGLPHLWGLRGERTRLAVGTFLLSFLPVFVAAGWVVTAATPRSSAGTHVLRWSGDIGIAGLVSDLSTFAGLLAFAAGASLLYCFAHRRLVVDEAPLVAEAPVETVFAGPPLAVAEPEQTPEQTSERAPVVTDDEVVAAPAVEEIVVAPASGPLGADDEPLEGTVEPPLERIDRERPLEPVAPRQAAGNGVNGGVEDAEANGSLQRDALAAAGRDAPLSRDDDGYVGTGHSAVDAEAINEREAVH